MPPHEPRQPAHAPRRGRPSIARALLEQRSAPRGPTVDDTGHAAPRTAGPRAPDGYSDNRRTGSFLLIDPADGATLTAGIAGGKELSPFRGDLTDA
ncbi:hypothetical protein ACFRAR_23715 [Kitasatospora sp. NPDC056651]|uniref:hypothetical protein n=1 Tax=Kitasatospora sp. NPDC056651 TaxID=3345892 RepID=UPI00369DDB5C